MADEKLIDFIKNEDDLDEWEREINEDDVIAICVFIFIYFVTQQTEEFNIMAPLKGEDKKDTKKVAKKSMKDLKPLKGIKRKSSFHANSQPKIWKKSA